MEGSSRRGNKRNEARDMEERRDRWRETGRERDGPSRSMNSKEKGGRRREEWIEGERKRKRIR